MTEMSSNRMVTLLAMQDITYRRLPRHLWSHTVVSTLLGVSPVFLGLTQAYLEHRRHDGPWMQRELRLTETGRHARVWDLVTDQPLDLVTLPTESDQVQLTHLLGLGTYRSIRVERSLLQKVERIIGHGCGATWATLEEAITAQRTAAVRERTIAA